MLIEDVRDPGNHGEHRRIDSHAITLATASLHALARHYERAIDVSDRRYWKAWRS